MLIVSTSTTSFGKLFHIFTTLEQKEYLTSTVAGLGDAVHAGHGHGIRRVDPQRQSAPLDRRHTRVLRAAARRTERLQGPLGGAQPHFISRPDPVSERTSTHEALSR